MKRLLLVLVPLALVVSACAVGEPKPPTDESATGITLNANVYSSIDGPTDYWFAYGDPGAPASWSETVHRTVDIADRDPHPVSEPIVGLEPDTVYGWHICVADQEESPPRTVCSKEELFGGDYVRGNGTAYQNGSPVAMISFNDVRSGPGGQNPAGSISGRFASGGPFSYQVSCLRVDGIHAAIGTVSGFFQVDVPADPSADGTLEVEVLNGRDPTDCPVPSPTDGPFVLDGSFTVQDAP